MYATLSLDEFITLAQHAKRIAVHQEISADCLTPIQIVANIKEEMRDGVVLESGLNHHDSGRYSYIAFGSLTHFSIQHANNTQSPFAMLRETMKQYACVSSHPQVKLMNGAVGFMTYDAVR